MALTPKADASMSMFDNVFVNPEAYKSFHAFSRCLLRWLSY